MIATAAADVRTYVRLTPPPYTPAMARRKILGAEKARAQFAARVRAAREQGEHTIVLNLSEPAAAIVPAAWYHRASAALGEPWEDWEPDEPEDESGEG
jgi:antitoxin (DNA-binding transcriptional repressor) of toxin-antitoxin stability system